MKRLLISTTPPTKVYNTDKKKKHTEMVFTVADVVDLLKNLPELRNRNVSAKYNDENSNLLIKIGDAIYEISSERYPSRRLREV